MLRLLAVLAALAIPVLGPSAAAAADKLPTDVQSVVDDFRADGEITPCKHTVAALERTSQLAPSDIAQYSPDFPAAVEAALEARPKEDCGATKGGESAGAGAGAAAPAASATPGAGGTATPGPTESATPAPTPQPTAAATPAPTPAPTAAPADPTYVTVSHTDPIPLGLWILAGLLVLSLLAWLVLALLGRTGWGEERLAGPRHACAEARYRAGGVWSDFADWLRFGR